jgi:hypothetical protein
MSAKQLQRRFVVTGVVGQHTTSNGNQFVTCSLEMTKAI